jgi:RNA polymerase sigma-70 factor (ECF subfamily)
MMELSKETLASAASGDQAAFAAIVRYHKSMVYSLAYHFFHDSGLAEELGQEVFLQLFQNLRKIESPAHLAFWLRRVTSHRCIDWSRRQSFRSQISLEELPDPPAPGRNSDPLLARRLRQLVANLPERARLIITLRYQEGLQLAEIAETLGIPLNTVKSHLQRSLAKLQEKLMAMEKLPV